MPTPIGFTAPEVDPFAGAAAKGASTDVPVLYATNRLPLIETPPPLFTALPAAQMRVGIAHVRIGDDSFDRETLHRLSTSDAIDERPIVELDWLEPKGVLSESRTGAREDPKEFFALVNRALEASPRREIVVYVHGANSPMPRAAAQAAQFQHFATRRVVVVSFMWPSVGSILRYLTDVGNAAASVEPLAQLLRELADNTHASAISVLAYSAGAKIAGPALALLAEPGRSGLRPAQARERLRLRNVYYAAPDADTRLFVEQMSQYIGIVGRVTVAINTRDSALGFSQWLHRVSRAGRPDPGELDPEQLSFIVQASRSLGFDLIHVDPDAIPGLRRRSHAFWYEHPWVSSDVIALMLFDAGPSSRGLEERTEANGARLWTFPSDYDQRVVRLFTRADSVLRPDSARSERGSGAAPGRDAQRKD
jgi:esterase/lipase superfamily enzyme